jgi:arsenite methyltransferase
MTDHSIDKSADKISATREMLAKHHRHGEEFAQMMHETFTGRFDESFWGLWQEHVEPVLPAQARIIDLGTGPGTFLKVIAERHPDVHAIGVECAPYMLDAATDLPANSEMLTSDLHDPHLPIEAGSIDAAVASVVVHEMHQPVKSFFEVFRILKPGGMFYILDWVRAPLQQYLQNTDLDVFNPETSVESLDDLFVHFIEHNRFTVEDLIFMLSRCGFELVVKQMLKDNQMARLLLRKPS